MSIDSNPQEAPIATRALSTSSGLLPRLKLVLSRFQSTERVPDSTPNRPVTEISASEPNSTRSKISINNESGGRSFPSNPSDLVIIIDETDGEEQGLTLDQIRFRAKEVLRDLPCRWKADAPCDAHLASHSLLSRHVKGHIEQAVSSVVQHPPYSPTWLNCGWYKCTSNGFATVHELEQHVHVAHLSPKLDLFCPFKDCPDRVIRSYAARESHFDDIRHHPRPWTNDSFLPTPRAKHDTLPLLSLPMKSALTVPPYLLSTHPVRPWPRGRPEHYVLPNRPRLRDFQASILPERNENVLFWPLCGEASPGDFDPSSSSIFPPNKRRDDTPVKQETDDKGESIIPSSSYSDARSFKFRKRVDGKLGRPRLAVTADIWAAYQRKLKLQERRRLAKGKMKMVLDESEEAVSLFDKEKIRLAAQRIAAKKVGSSIGIEFWKEVLAFEAEGVALGEIPR